MTCPEAVLRHSMFIRCKFTHLYGSSSRSQVRNNLLAFIGVYSRHGPTGIIPSCASVVTPVRRFQVTHPAYHPEVDCCAGLQDATTVTFCPSAGPLDSLFLAIAPRNSSFGEDLVPAWLILLRDFLRSFRVPVYL